MNQKEKIIDATIQCMKKGNIEDISIRKIADVAQIGKSTIGYYFPNKEILLSTCADKIISDLLHGFNKEDLLGKSIEEELMICLTGTMDYLFNNEEISILSIIFDINNPKMNDNTMKMVNAFSYVISNGNVNDQSQIKAFYLASHLQEIFIRRKDFNKICGIDIYNKDIRDKYLEKLIKNVLKGEYING